MKPRSRSGRSFRFAALLLLSFVSRSLTAADPFAENIRTTPWRSPAEEQRSFQVPAGFEIQLVASEPDIHKPMNLAFDTAGRLWVTTTIEYPIPAPTNAPGRDRIMIFADFGADGKARKVTQFATGLNIPIGVYPFQSRNPDGRETWKAIVWSIPHIWLLEDLDGDGQADKREILYANFDYTRDTHGNQASFRRGFDGWLYCTHGYNNDTHMKGRDGHEVQMNSGNTYRIRLDGSRIEHYTHGQVNPFGLAFDPEGNLFASDCHSEPIYQLLADGYYPSFGKPHDGLGFAPKMQENKRGSTAIDGLSIYSDDLWPAEFRGNIFIGDVMMSRVFRDRVREVGSTRISSAMPDLIGTDDPWFRPVDTRLGPDGALYVADFYNRVIGHYEVPLNHPGRDRTSGRIWRLVYKGQPLRPSGVPATLEGLLTELSSPNLTRRLLAQNAITDRFGTNGSVNPLRGLLNTTTPSAAQVHALWALLNLNELDQPTVASACASTDRLLRVHGMRILAEVGRRLNGEVAGTLRGFNRSSILQLASGHLNDPDALVQRCAAEVLGVFPQYGNIQPLLDLVRRVPAEDTHLLYVARKALRDQLIPEENLRRLAENPPVGADLDLITELALGVRTETAAGFLLQRLRALNSSPGSAEQIARMIKHAARHAPERELSKITSAAETPLPGAGGAAFHLALERQFLLFKAFDEGLQERGLPLTQSGREWGSNLVSRFFANYQPAHSWTALPDESNPSTNPWGSETRACADGQGRSLISSLPYGDELTGTLRSQPFPIPARLEFWYAGQDGFPNNPAQQLNRIRLREFHSGSVLVEAFSLRTNVAQKVIWDLAAQKGRQGYIEAIDGNDDSDSGWLAFGEFQPALPQLQPPQFAPRRVLDWLTTSAQIAVRVPWKEGAHFFGKYAIPGPDFPLAQADPEGIAAFARTWVALDPAQALPALCQAVSATNATTLYRERIAEILIAQNRPDAQQAVLVAMKNLPQKAQERLSYPLATATFSAETLLAGMENGSISPRVLQRVGVNNRLRSSQPRDWQNRVAKLKTLFPTADDARDRLIADYKAACASAPGNPERGRQVFAKNCAPCHRLGAEGALIGPQLDGIGQRGLDRLCEDILDPNRNVDIAFRTTILTLKDGEQVTGLFRREQGEVIILADITGREISAPKSSVAQRKESETSLMPENFGEILNKEDFKNLLALLLATPEK